MTSPIEALGPLASPIPPTEMAGGVAPTSDFGSWLNTQLDNVNDQLIQADQQVRKLATGETENLHQVMISLEKAKLSFELLLQVRNRVLESYQDIMRMQV